MAGRAQRFSTCSKKITSQGGQSASPVGSQFKSSAGGHFHRFLHLMVLEYFPHFLLVVPFHLKTSLNGVLALIDYLSQTTSPKRGGFSFSLQNQTIYLHEFIKSLQCLLQGCWFSTKKGMMFIS